MILNSCLISRNLFRNTSLLFCKKSFTNINNRNIYRSSLLQSQSSLLIPKNNKIKNILTLRQTIKGFCTKANESTTKGQKAVGWWLAGCSGMVFVAVALGGITRLTESGLSMSHWKLLGEKPPTTQEDWIREFEIYKQFPEFKIKNKEMTLEEFKFIFWMEYGHRMWGRLIGAMFAIPAAYFWSKGYFNKAMKIKVGIFGTLIGLQGLMGWYMVKSGLEDRFHGENDVPRVSQYRLAAHLSFAFALYILFLMSSLDHLLPTKQQAIEVTANALKLRKLAHISKGMVFLTAVSGAFVAGLDAGLVYNSFPKFADRWIPSDLLAFSPTIKNFTENPTTVQFDHRILGTSTLALITGMYMLSRKCKLPNRAHTAATAVVLMGWAQVILGISTLLTYVPVTLATSHQSGSLILLSMAVWLTHELKWLKKIPK
ncbi:hypothetical protein PVAND_011748 [Polypedilum vanderplanki]|uniref:Cytochrome c oxidase assembly protein COX15-like protein n=1 Tax=Polypedilum vanderplanki TaxID=319348 RepID=A0A9J6CL69_POLVA|nr:hypothetical protein PVAND_011748 [Polypedilum vanderplanki]